MFTMTWNVHNVLILNEIWLTGRAEWNKGLRTNSLRFEDKVRLFVRSSTCFLLLFLIILIIRVNLVTF